MTLGIIARCDTGGLAALTREVHRHLHPSRTLLLDLEEQGRGDCTPDEYTHGNTYRAVYKGGLPERAIEWAIAEGIDTLWSAETFYDWGLLARANSDGIRTICYAMPELAPWAVDPDATHPRELHVPTWWRLDTLPNAHLLPFPVARDRLPFMARKRVTHLFHPAAPAMLDRNGTQLLLDALPFLAMRAENEVRLTIRSHIPLTVPPGTRIQVDVIGSDASDYWDAYPADIDLLVLPRRYGGLSLPVQECAAMGVPAVMMQSDAYAQETFVTAVPSTGSKAEWMKGGRQVPVHSADPRVLAGAIDFLIEHPDVQAAASTAADEWAAAHDWLGPLGDRWASLLGAER